MDQIANLEISLDKVVKERWQRCILNRGAANVYTIIVGVEAVDIVIGNEQGDRHVQYAGQAFVPSLGGL